MSIISASQPTVHSGLRRGHLRKSECFRNANFSDFIKDKGLPDTNQAEITTFERICMPDGRWEHAKIPKKAII